MSNKRKIQSLRDDFDCLECKVKQYVTEENSRFLIDKRETICIEIRDQYTYINFWGLEELCWSTSKAYYKKGTEPKCDYVKKYMDNRIEYIKNDVVCDKDGGVPPKVEKIKKITKKN